MQNAALCQDKKKIRKRKKKKTMESMERKREGILIACKNHTNMGKKNPLWNYSSMLGCNS